MVITTQFFRYAVVGLASNLVLYAGYLLLTWTGMGHKLAMSFLYGIGVLQTFFFNRKWSFEHQGAAPQALARYVAAYIFGYLLNLAGLLLLVDRLGFPHQVVQGMMILIFAMMLFLLQKYWVFSSTAHEPEQEELSL